MKGDRRRSKRQSAANFKSKPPENPPIFLDASLGRHTVAEALRKAGATVIAHNDLFSESTPDQDWLQRAGESGWLVFTKDQRVRYRELEKRAIRRFRVGAFFLVGKNLTGLQMAQAFVAALPRAYRLNRNTARPFIAKVTAAGTVQLVEGA